MAGALKGSANRHHYRCGTAADVDSGGFEDYDAKGMGSDRRTVVTHLVLRASNGLLVRGGAWAGIVGGLLWVPVYLTPVPDLFAAPITALLVASAPLLIVAAAAVQQRQAGEVGALGWPGLVIFDVALLIAVASLTWFGPGGWWVALYAVCFPLPLGALLFAVATLWAGVVSRTGAILVAAGALGLPLIILWNEDRIWATGLSAVFGLGWTVLGLALWRADRNTA